MKKKGCEHKYEFVDIEDTGDDILKIYKCECGVKMIDRYIFIGTDYEEAKRESEEEAL